MRCEPLSRVPATVLVAGLLVVGGLEPGPDVATATPAALRPARGGGVEVVDRALAKLSVHARMLVVGAHPDDEDNALLTWVSRGLGGDAAYLSLSRGEGGQNLIGTELGESLGVIRTGELQAAREIEGTRQYFARAFDFGYTRSLDETFERWPADVLLEDALRAARRFKPQVIVSIFPPDARAGHGQHQASAVIARETFEGAGDGSVMPDLGLPLWSPRALYRRAWRREEATAGFDLGHLDPMDGRSLGQIAAASRSQHRSQDMGRTQPLGSGSGGLVWLAGAGEGGEQAFSEIDTRLRAIAAHLPPGTARGEVEALLVRVEELAGSARDKLAPARLSESVPALADIVRELDGAIALVGEARAARAVRELLFEKRTIAARALAAAAGVVIDAVAAREVAVGGEALNVEASVWPADLSEVELDSVDLIHSLGAVEPRLSGPTETRGVLSWQLEVDVPLDARPSRPYSTWQPRDGDLYDWSAVGERVRGLPSAPPITVRFDLRIEGVEVRLDRPVVYRYGDQAFGEIRRPIRIVPRVEVELAPRLKVLPLATTDRIELELSISSNVEEPVAGVIELALSTDRWSAPERLTYSIDEPQGSVKQTVVLTPVGEPISEGFEIDGAALGEDGARWASGFSVLDYPHIGPNQIAVAAHTDVRLVDVELPTLDRVGYLRGASDRVPEMLREVGLEVELLSGADLADLELSDYDVVVVGSRAYETDAGLRESNARLLDYVRAGGTLIVQYQQYQFVRGGFAPRPLDISRPHGRVTDETSPVRVLEPEHPIFRTPNRIDSDDWAGWVQERGLYFADTWDEAYVPLLALQDPGDQPEQRGSLLIASVGEGTYVYTGLSFFRELPAGVPGAYRLFANLLALGAS